MGRRKIDILPLENERNRSVTFLKRKAGLFKKAYELAVLCQVEIAIVIFGNNDRLYEFSSGNLSEIITKCNGVKPYESKRLKDYGGKGDDDDDDGDDDGKDTPSPDLPKQKFKSHSRSTSQASNASPRGSRKSHSKKNSVSSVNGSTFSTPSLKVKSEPMGTPQVNTATLQSNSQTAPAPPAFQTQQYQTVQSQHPQVAIPHQHAHIISQHGQHTQGIMHPTIIYPSADLQGSSRQMYHAQQYAQQQVQGAPNVNAYARSVPPNMQSSASPSQYTQHAQMNMYPPQQQNLQRQFAYPSMSTAIYSREMEQQQQVQAQQPGQHHSQNSSYNNIALIPNPQSNDNKSSDTSAADSNTHSVNQNGSTSNGSNNTSSVTAGSNNHPPPPNFATPSMIGIHNDRPPYLAPQTSSTPSPINGKNPMALPNMRPKLKVQIPLGQNTDGQITSSERSNRSFTDDLQDKAASSSGPSSSGIGNGSSSNGNGTQGGSVFLSPTANASNGNSSGSNGGGESSSMAASNSTGSSSGNSGTSSWGVHLPPPSPSSILNPNSTLGPGNPLNRPPLVSNGEQTPLSAALPSRLVNDLLPSPSNFYSNDWGFGMSFNGPTSAGIGSSSSTIPSLNITSSSSSGGLPSATGLTTPGGIFSMPSSHRNHLNLDMLPSPLQFNTPVMPMSLHSLSDTRSDGRSPTTVSAGVSLLSSSVTTNSSGTVGPSSLAISSTAESNNQLSSSPRTGEKRDASGSTSSPGKRQKN